MKNSAQKIRTSHVGRLPVPSGFEETALRLARGEALLPQMRHCLMQSEQVTRLMTGPSSER